MRTFLFVVLSAFFVTPALAQSLSDQINAVAAAEDQEKAAEQAAIAAQQQQQRRVDARHDNEIRQAKREQQALHAQAAAAARAREEELVDEARVKTTEAAADKKRDQTYDDKLREIDLEEKLASLQADKARAARANDFIDRELAQKSAETDVTKSQADATRNVTSGEKALLERTGEAEIKNASGSSSEQKSQSSGF